MTNLEHLQCRGLSPRHSVLFGRCWEGEEWRLAGLQQLRLAYSLGCDGRKDAAISVSAQSQAHGLDADAGEHLLSHAGRDEGALYNLQKPFDDV